MINFQSNINAKHFPVAIILFVCSIFDVHAKTVHTPCNGYVSAAKYKVINNALGNFRAKPVEKTTQNSLNQGIGASDMHIHNFGFN